MAEEKQEGRLEQRVSRSALGRQCVVFLTIWVSSSIVVLVGSRPLLRRYSPGPRLLTVILVAFLLQFALYWLPGFPALRNRIGSTFGRRANAILIGALLLAPNFVYGVGTGAWSEVAALKLVGITVFVLGVYVFIPPRGEALSWKDIVVMSAIALPVATVWFRDVWPFPVYLDVMARLFAVALAAFAVILVRPLSGVGYEWRLRGGDWLEGCRQLGLYAVVGIPLGLALRFIAWHPQQIGPAILLSFLRIIVFIAVPEELFFRGLLQNLLEKSLANRYIARAIASALFGFCHIQHGFPNWRYVIMAAIAGWFYGTAWHRRRSVVASSVTHAAVDTLWHHFLTI